MLTEREFQVIEMELEKIRKFRRLMAENQQPLPLFHEWDFHRNQLV